MSSKQQTALILAFTAIFIGYLTVWLPGPGAGLSFLGIEMGEWFKFLGLGAQRDFFYLPPITLGLMLIIWTITWPRQGWRAWLMRALGILISLLTFPAIEDITGPVREQYTLRVWLIALVLAAAMLSAFWQPQGKWQRLPWVLLALLGLIGLLLPSWIYLQVRPFASQIMGVPIGVGVGVLLNGVGHIMVVIVSLLQLASTSRSLPVTQGQKT